MIKPNINLDPSLLIKPWDLTEIVSSKTFQDGRWKELCASLNHPEPNIEKHILPIDFGGLDLLVVTAVPPDTSIGTHRHDEPVLRYVTRGEFTLNDEAYAEGDWVLVPKDRSYAISTVAGYTALMGYGEACQGGGDVSPP